MLSSSRQTRDITYESMRVLRKVGDRDLCEKTSIWWAYILKSAYFPSPFSKRGLEKLQSGIVELK